MRILTLDAALSGCSVGLVVDGIAERSRHADGLDGDGRRAHVALAAMAEAVMQGRIDLVAVTLGPGSFTGLRAAIALAHGIALGAGVPLVGVTVAEALAEELAQQGGLGGRALWVGIDSRRNRVFLHRGTTLISVDIEALPSPAGPVALAGDAATTLAAHLAARGHDVMLTDARMPMPRPIAAVARRRAAGELAPLPVLPVYVDAPEARQTVPRPPPGE